MRWRVSATIPPLHRPGEAEHNVLLRMEQAEEALAILDPPLTEKGRRQVEALRKYKAEEGYTFDLVSCHLAEWGPSSPRAKVAMDS